MGRTKMNQNNYLMKILPLLFLIIIMLCSVCNLFADTLYMREGSTVEGTILTMSDEAISLNTPSGKMIILRSRISKIVKESPTTGQKEEITLTPVPMVTPRIERPPKLILKETTPTPIPTPQIEPTSMPPKEVPIEKPEEKWGEETPVQTKVTPQEIQATPIPHATPSLIPPTPEPLAEKEKPSTEISEEQTAILKKLIVGSFKLIEQDALIKSLATEFRKALLGDPIYVQDEIKTTVGKTIIDLKGRGEVRLPINSHIQVVYADATNTNIKIKLLGGKIWTKIEKTAAQNINFQVQTPGVVAGVRGTIFKVELLPGNEERIAVLEGLVSVLIEKTGEKVDVQANQAWSIKLDTYLSALTPTTEVDRREWEEWDKWVEDMMGVAVMFPVGGNVIMDMSKQTAMEQKMYAQMMDESNKQVKWNQVGDALDVLKEGVIRFAKDVKRFPTEEEGLKALLENPGVRNWKGPYIPPQTPYPVKDRWGTDIYYEKHLSPTGNEYYTITSAGPNKIYRKGKWQADEDIWVIINPNTIISDKP